MTKKSLTVIAVAHLSIDDLHTISAKAIEDATLVKDSISALPVAALDALVTSNANMGENRNRVIKSTKTAKLQEADKLRDDWFAELKRKVTNAAKSLIVTEKEAGIELKTFLAPYWHVYRQSIATETDSLKQMNEKYAANETIQQHATTIGVSSIFAQIETANLATDTLYNSRTQELVANSGPSASSYKNEVVTNYTDFCHIIELAVNYTPNDTYNTLFTALNEQRNKFAVMYNVDDKNTEAVVEDAAEANIQSQ